MNFSELTILDNSRKAPSQITDVVLFFQEVTEAYKDLRENILQISYKIPTSSPQEILDECKRLGQKRTELAGLDQKMLDIMNLIGHEIAQEPIIYDYRVAFASANMACNNLYQKLKALRCSFEE